MKSNSVLILGCGDLGARTGALLMAQGWQIAGVRRDIARLPAAFEGYAADYTKPGSLDFLADLRPDWVLTTCNPTARSVAGYKAGFAGATANLLAGLGEHRPRHIIAVTSTRVFAERQGGWVEENSPLATDDPRAAAMIEAEQLLLTSGHAVSLVRFAGIYGASGGRLLARVAAGELCSPQPVRYSNRIHRDDCAGFLAHLLQRSAAGEALQPVYIGVDNAPVPQYEVETWLAGKLGVEAAARSSAGGLDPSAGRSASGHKRCRNRALRNSGYQLRYPDYRSGYGAVLQGR